MEDTKLTQMGLGIILRTPGVVMIEMLYMEAISLQNLTVLSNSFFVTAFNPDVLLYLIAWSLVLMPLRILLKVYLHVVAGLCIIGSHYALFNLLVKRKIFEDNKDLNYYLQLNTSVQSEPWAKVACQHGAMDNCVSVFLFQVFLTLLSCWMIKSQSTKLMLYVWPLVPWITGGYSSTTLVQMLQLCHLLSIATVVFYLTSKVEQVILQAKLMVLKIKLVIGIFGWQGIITWAQEEYRVQYLLITCWVLRYTVQLYSNFYTSISLDGLYYSLFNMLDMNPTEMSNIASLIFVGFYTAVQCLTTTVNLFGLACIVKDVVRLQYFLIRSWLHWSVTDHPPDSVSGPLTGAIDGVTLLIMTLYTDILHFNDEGRFVLLIYILFTIASSQFQSIFSIVDPILMTLATAHTGSVWKHIRTVLLAFLLLFISGLLSYISLFTMRSTFWIFIVAYNYINTFSLMLGSLAIYFILMIDYLTIRGWNSLDDVMFYIRGACRAVEFCVTLCMCGYIMMTFYTEMTSMAGIIMLAVYTYYCIVQRGGKGWKIWTMRRQASNKVCSLPQASKKDLIEKKGDLCPICYQGMEADVRIMHCGHLFHENCLKKWFYIQDKCPMCYMEYNPNLNASKLKAGNESEHVSDNNATSPEPSESENT
uniref:RING finger protein 145 n=1 Tax=Phallusia mammillata TaxID=59560 RepID=A0A6F9DR21_9ASCI|nr:RING finger protein 145 [Phallusia mammillata]